LRLFCFADEAHRLSYSKSPVDTMLREARKYGMGMILSSQSPHDFEPIVFANAATKISFRLPLEEDALFLSKQKPQGWSLEVFLPHSGQDLFFVFKVRDLEIREILSSFDNRI
jgi:hypothetical protein